MDLRNKIICGDCLEVMRGWPNDFVDAIVTDPPYGLGFMGKDWDTFKEAKAIHKEGHYITKAADGSPVRHQKGFSAASSAGLYDHSRNAEFQQWFTIWATEVLRIAKPGAIMFCFGGTRTYHRLTCAIEDAGWQIRDCMMWLYGSGFPKSLNISKAIDKAKGAKREIIGKREGTYADIRRDKDTGIAELHGGIARNKSRIEVSITAPATNLANLWDGYGTALKPAWEPIIVAMKPLDGTFAQNAEKWKVAGLNINGARIGTEDNLNGGAYSPSKDGMSQNKVFGKYYKKPGEYKQPQGRWPANLILDEEAAAMLDEQSGITKSSGGSGKASMGALGKSKYGKYALDRHSQHAGGLGDSGGASRFFYCAKSSRAERNAGLDCEPQITNDGRKKKIDNAYLPGKTLRRNNHPTVKPLKLMEYLCRLVKPPTEHPILLDCFYGSGTTLMAAVNTGWDYVGVEKEPEYVEIAKRRVAYTVKQLQGQMPLFEGAKK